MPILETAQPGRGRRLLFIAAVVGCTCVLGAIAVSGGTVVAEGGVISERFDGDRKSVV